MNHSILLFILVTMYKSAYLELYEDILKIEKKKDDNANVIKTKLNALSLSHRRFHACILYFIWFDFAPVAVSALAAERKVLLRRRQESKAAVHSTY